MAAPQPRNSRGTLGKVPFLLCPSSEAVEASGAGNPRGQLQGLTGGVAKQWLTLPSWHRHIWGDFHEEGIRALGFAG